MDPLRLIAENKIREAMEKGEFDNLSCQGKEIDLYDDQHISPEFRMAYRLLKNMENSKTDGDLIKQIRALKAEAQKSSDDPKMQKLEFLKRYKKAQSATS